MALKDWSAGHIVGMWVVGIGAAWLLGRFGVSAIRGGAGGGVALITTTFTIFVAGILMMVTMRWFRARLMR